MKIEEAAILALHNKNRLIKAVRCGCFGCFKIFNVDEIKEYTDNDDTALCPYCTVDCVVEDDGNLTEEFLQKANKYWF